jgi:hypothetical protein
MIKELLTSIETIKSKNEKFTKEEDQSTEEPSTEGVQNNGYYGSIAFVIFFIIWVFLVVVVGKMLWNESLVPATNLKKITTWQFLGIFILIKILFPNVW